MASQRVLRGTSLKSNNTNNNVSLQISATTLPPSHHGIHLPSQIPQARKAISERSRNIIQTQNELVINKIGKRKAELSPINNEKTKRYALGNLTNHAALLNNNNNHNNNNNKTIKHNNEDDIKINITNNKHCDKLLRKTANITSKTASVILHNINNNNNNNKNNVITTNNNVIASIPANTINTATKTTKKFTKNLKKENSIHPQEVKLNTVSSALPSTNLNNNNNNNNNNNSNNNEVKPTKILTRAAARATKLKEEIHDTVVKPKDNKGTDLTINQKPPATRRISNEFEKTEDSLYISALADVSSDSFMGRPKRNSLKSLSSSSENGKLPPPQAKTFDDHERISNLSSNNSAITLLTTLDNSSLQSTLELNEFKTPSNHLQMDVDILIRSKKLIPADIDDFDRENWKDPHQVSNYVMDIFFYLRHREQLFPINDYMPKQINLSIWMRTLLVDWMVEVQETFELNHETLYLAVKLVDLYLDKVVIAKDKLQLLGAAALFISCKFDERMPPLVTDFMYICDGAYTRREIIKMESDVFKHIGYDLGIPISYRFLRRYSRCAKVPVHKLTLARYILEYSLMDYDTIFFSDSKMACAALYMALRMHNQKNVWDKTLEYYTDYKLDEFKHVIATLNAGLHQPCRPNIKTVRSKYSHPVFHEVTRVPLMSTETLLELS